MTKKSEGRADLEASRLQQRIESSILSLKDLDDSNIDCNMCVGCKKCINCTKCINCVNCVNCENCMFCENCVGCINCNGVQKICDKCINCHDCYDCKECKECLKCKKCRDCMKCSYCNECINVENMMNTYKNIYYQKIVFNDSLDTSGNEFQKIDEKLNLNKDIQNVDYSYLILNLNSDSEISEDEIYI